MNQRSHRALVEENNSPLKRRRPSLRAIAVFEAAARHLSFQFAAQELNLTPSAISHQIKALEQHLGKSLFVRGNKGLRLTSAGSRYQRSASEALAKIDSGTLELLEAAPIEETLIVRVGVSFAQKWLLPKLPLFLAEHPSINLLIDTRAPGGFATTEAADIEIRYGHVEQPGCHMIPLQVERILPFCSPALLRGVHPLREPKDLARHTLIESQLSRITWPKWLAEAKQSNIGSPRLRFDRSSLAIQAAVYGMGIALEGDFLAREELASGRLITPFALRKTAIWEPLRFLLIPDEKIERAGVQAFQTWMLREMV